MRINKAAIQMENDDLNKSIALFEAKHCKTCDGYLPDKTFCLYLDIDLFEDISLRQIKEMLDDGCGCETVHIRTAFHGKVAL